MVREPGFLGGARKALPAVFVRFFSDICLLGCAYVTSVQATPTIFLFLDIPFIYF